LQDTKYHLLNRGQESSIQLFANKYDVSALSYFIRIFQKKVKG